MSLVSIDIHVSRLGDVLAIFDEIEVHRSTSGEGGPYVEITDPNGPTSAIIDGSAEGGFNLSGLTLEVAIDLASPQQVTFTGTDPLDIATVIAQINDEIPGLASEVPTDTDKLRLTSPSSGTGSALLVTANAAATELGLSTTKVNGKADRIPLVDPVTNYTFLDLDGDQSYFYKTRYSSTTSGTTSSFSDARQGSADTVIPSAQLSIAKIWLTTGDGKPVVGRCIVFHPQQVHQAETTDYFLLPGFDGRVFITTNEQGFAQIPLIRGGKYKVHFEGSSYMREFEVPDQTEFDLLPLIGSLPDPFDIVQAPSKPIKVST